MNFLCMKKKVNFKRTITGICISLPGMGELLQNMLDAGLSIPTFQIDHIANFSHGNLVFITYEHFPEMHDIFKRFAKVFEQTYTRFLDLQKAEAQAREAQIEAALERVRCRTMAMQQSDELREVISVVFEKLSNWKFRLTGSINIYIERSRDMMYMRLAIMKTCFKQSIRIRYFDQSIAIDL